jgi:hypothetical protein
MAVAGDGDAPLAEIIRLALRQLSAGAQERGA